MKRTSNQLRKALGTLPDRIAYLRNAILSIAAQDQELLGSGAADTRPLTRSLRERTGGQGVADEASAAANALQRWLEQQPDSKAAWAGPVVFVQAFLSAYDEFCEMDDADAEPPPAVLGLRRTEIDIPKGMKVKEYADGIELSDRQVRMFVIESPPDVRETMRRGYEHPAPLPPGFESPPHVRDERDLHFHIGPAWGIRLISYHVETGLPVMCNYLLDQPAMLEVGIYARDQRGADMTKYEQLLATIRGKGSDPVT